MGRRRLDISMPFESEALDLDKPDCMGLFEEMVWVVDRMGLAVDEVMML